MPDLLIDKTHMQEFLKQRQLATSGAATMQTAGAHGLATPRQPGNATLPAGNAFLFKAGSMANGQPAPAQTGKIPC